MKTFIRQMTMTAVCLSTFCSAVAFANESTVATVLPVPPTTDMVPAPNPSTTVEQAPAQPTPQPAAPAPSPYSLPWQLRSAGVGNVLRLDTVVAPYGTDDMNSGTALVSMLGAGYKLSPSWGLVARVGAVRNMPDVGERANSFINPVLGGVYAFKLGSDFRVALLGAAALPLGMGGGNTPNKDAAKANGAGGLARSGMDGTMFAVNDLSLIPGVDVAYVAHKLTVQAEATIGQLFRTRGQDVQVDAARTNLLCGLHAGYYLFAPLSVASELRYQRWLSTPDAVAKNSALRDNLTVAFGFRAHFKVATTWMRPGVSYTHGLRGAVSDREYRILQIDIPVIF